MRLLRQKKNGNGGTPEGVQSRLEKVFKLAGESTSLNVFTRDDKGRLQYVDSIALSDVTASTLLDVIKNGYGGGRFQIVPMGGDRKAGESFEVSVHGESKLAKKKTPDDSQTGQKRSSKQTEVAELREENRELRDKDRESRFLESVREEIQKAIGKRDGSGEVVDAIVKNLPEVVAGLSALLGNRESMDPFQLVSGVLQLLSQHNQQQNRAPVQTTGSTSTGIEKFFEGLGAAVPAFAPMIAAKMNPAGTPESPAALPANTGGTMPPANNPAAFAGAEGAHSPSAPPSTTTPGPVGTMNPVDAFSAPLGPVDGAPGDPRVAAYGAIIKLRYLIQQKDDPHSIAGEIIDSINLIMGAQRIGGRWQNFIDEENAGTLFDQYAPMITEFAADPAYMAECRAALLEVIHEHLNPSSESIDEGKEEPAQEEAAKKIEDAEQQSEAVEQEAQPQE